jgi:hypothetical protein
MMKAPFRENSRAEMVSVAFFILVTHLNTSIVYIHTHKVNAYSKASAAHSLQPFEILMPQAWME